MLSQSERIYEAGLPPLITPEADDALSDALEDLQVRVSEGLGGGVEGQHGVTGGRVAAWV
jgi:hypothetical protein